jgi:hypothetical protein
MEKKKEKSYETIAKCHVVTRFAYNMSSTEPPLSEDPGDPGRGVGFTGQQYFEFSCKVFGRKKYLKSRHQ